MDVSGDEVAEVVLKQFDAFPTKAKPLVRGGGVREWVPLSAIVAQGKDNLTCLAAATGMKCLPQDKISRAQGIVLHDWHAEVLAIRSFNRFLLQECYALMVSQKQSSEYIRLRKDEERSDSHFQPFALNDGIVLHMYCSEAPCGDASMELTMAAQEDPTPWTIPSPTSNGTANEVLTTSSNPLSSVSANSNRDSSPDPAKLQGRGFFSELGTIRRKPSRPDAPPTLSKSCSDKMALKQCTSILSSITSLLISPSNVYISSLVLPESQYSETACKRAFSSEGRMRDLKAAEWDGEYHFKEFAIKSTSKEFKHSRRQLLDMREKLVPSNISASWFASHASSHGQLEVLIGGVLQGRKQFDVRGASRGCRSRIWKLAMEIMLLVTVPTLETCLRSPTYGELKSSECLEWRRRVKDDAREKALRPWVRNLGGENFGVAGVEA